MLSAEMKNALNATQLSHDLEQVELELLMSHINAVSFSAGDIILKQGNNSPGIFIIIEGTAIVTTRTLGSETTNIATLSVGDILGEISVLTNEPSSTSILASNSVRCLLITNVYLEFLSLYFPALSYKILLAITKQICSRLKNTCQRIVEFVEKSDMTTQPILGRVITSLTKAVSISYNEVDLEQLKNKEFFSLFSKEEFEILLAHSKLIQAAKHCILIDEKDKDASCYIVIRGAVQSSIISNNVVAKLSVLGPTILFCGVSTIDAGSPSIINFTTCEQAILFKITPSDLDWIKHNNKQLWNKFFNLICKSLVALEKSVLKLNIRLKIELYNR